MSFFGNLFNREKREARDRKIAVSDNPSARIKIAKSAKTQPELLYYLAQNDPDASVRHAVAKNRSTPVHASSVLAKDIDADVRLALADRLVRLLPNLSMDKQSQLYEFAVQALGTLALDEVLKIRIALSSALRDHAHAPPKIVGQLARDIEREVSEPILRFCLALSDDDILDILKNHQSPWALNAIAGRENISEAISQAIIDRNDEDTGVTLLENRTALISISTLTSIVEKSKLFKKWQKPIAIRKNLPKELAKQLIEFVDESVQALLMERTDYDTEFRHEISSVVKRRLELMDKVETNPVSAEDRVRQMIREKTLNEEAVSDALAIKDKDLAIVALAALNRTNRSTIEKVLGLQKPKPVIAVCWKAGLSMRLCLRIQQELAHIPPKELIYPRGGTDYPLEEAEIKWQLEFLDL